MQIIQEVFEKVVYESDTYKTVQKDIDYKLEQIIAHCMDTHDTSKEELRDEIMAALYDAEREMFAIGFQYGVRLMHESGISSDDIHNL